MGLGEAHEGEHAGLGIVHQRGELGNCVSSADVILVLFRTIEQLVPLRNISHLVL
jgi:hypothetical protein